MARIRSLHPGQWTDEQFVTCSPLARLLCLGLRNEADDGGVFEWKPVTLKMRILPADNCDAVALLAELEAVNSIRSYEIGGRKFGAIRNFKRFQRPKKPNQSHPRAEWVEAYVAASSEPETDDDGSGSEAVGNQSGTASENPNQMKEGIRVLGKNQIPVEPNGKSGEGHEAEAAFERFWRLYPPPRRIDKKQARKAWDKALKAASPDEIINGLTRHVLGWEGKDPEFIPHPTTWLNRERWKYEPPERGPRQRPDIGELPM
jgi:hypothetical protein